MPKKISEGEALFNFYWRTLAQPLPAPVNGHRFHDTRNWQLDCAWPDRKLAVEIDGGEFVRGRHTRGLGFQNDCEKINAAIDAGWRVYRYTLTMLRTEPHKHIGQVVAAWGETRA